MKMHRVVQLSVLAVVFGIVCVWPVLAGAIVVAVPPTVLAPANGALVGDVVTVSGTTDTDTVDVVVEVKPEWEPTRTAPAFAPVSSPGTFSVSVAVPYGRSVISVLARTADDTSTVVERTVWNLGAVPGYPGLVLVDKSDLYLYLIRNGAVWARYPIAIGMPRTPTPVGTWTLGRPMRGGGGWGALRMPLMRQKWVRKRVTVHVRRRHVRRWVRRRVYVKTSYYIHGTNDPSSIGTWASLGCVRLFNEDVRALAAMTGIEPCVIRQ
jgi:lipoprotein-anchoring transpeptidase ErfK/SrfK